jgi:uncharacterized protein (TIGR03437 family)
LFQVNVSSDQSVAFQAAASSDDGSDWLSIDSSNGFASTQAPGKVTVTVNHSKLQPGVYTGDVSVSFSNPVIRTENITLVVLPQNAVLASTDDKDGPRSATNCTGRKLAVNSSALANAFSSPAGWPTSLNIRVTDDCGSAVASARVVATFSNGDPAMAMKLNNPTGADYTATWAPTNATPQMTVTVTALAQGLETATTKMIGTVGANIAPNLQSNSTVNNLNLDSAGAALAPGTVAQVSGGALAPVTETPGLLPLATSFANTSVLIGLHAAPIYFVSDRQINIQIPTELQTDGQYSILVSSGAAFTLPDTIAITSVSPGLLNLAQHADFRTVTAQSPVVPGELITLYLVGMGATDRTVPSGTTSPATPLANVTARPTVSIGGREAEVVFAGLTPGSVGLYQINIRTPENLPSGVASLTVTQGDAASNTVTIPIR